MKIDKTRFLLLTTTIATTAAAAVLVSTSGCSTTSTTTDAGTSSSSGGSSSGSSGSSDSGGNTDGSSSSSSGSSGADSGGDAAATCLGNTGQAPFCGPEVEGTDAGAPAKCQLECDAVSGNFKNEVAASISGCMDLAPACEGAAADCITKALAKSCDDPAAAAYCTTLLTTCAAGVATVTQAECEAVAKAMSDQGKTALTTCVVEGGCGPCVDQIKAGL